MPLFNTELDRLADSIGASALTIRLHTSAPSHGSPTSGRVTVGGNTYENGVTVQPSDISNASGGDIRVTTAINFGTADEDVGTVTHWSAYRGANPVAFGTLTSTQINANDSWSIAADALRINGSST